MSKKELEFMSMEKKIHNKKKYKIMLLIIALIVLAVLGISYAWFYSQQKVASITRIASPGEIIISGVHGKDMEQIDLSYGSEDVNNNNTVTVRNVICIDSLEKDFILQLAHTTNVTDLSLRVYPATESDIIPNTNSNYVKGSDGGTDYYYSYNPTVGYTTKRLQADTDDMKLLQCKNPKDDDSGMALESGEYHNNTYGQNETRVQNQAEPLYWESTEQLSLPLTINNGKKESEVEYKENANIKYDYYGYYVLEASWTEKDKETDVVCVMAKYNHTTKGK